MHAHLAALNSVDLLADAGLLGQKALNAPMLIRIGVLGQMLSGP